MDNLHGDMSFYTQSFYKAFGSSRSLNRVDDLTDAYNQVPNKKDIEDDRKARTLQMKVLMAHLFGDDAVKSFSKEPGLLASFAMDNAEKIHRLFTIHRNNISKVGATLKGLIAGMTEKSNPRPQSSPMTVVPLMESAEVSSWIMESGKLVEVVGDGPSVGDTSTRMANYLSLVGANSSSGETSNKMADYISGL